MVAGISITNVAATPRRNINGAYHANGPGSLLYIHVLFTQEEKEMSRCQFLCPIKNSYHFFSLSRMDYHSNCLYIHSHIALQNDIQAQLDFATWDIETES
jgi:hypothetical protein